MLHIDPHKVTTDLKKLKAKAKKLKLFATRFVAHSDERGLESLPTFEELNDCLDFLEDPLKKYLLLFRATSHLSIVPVMQFDWKKIFQGPWIPPKSFPED